MEFDLTAGTMTIELSTNKIAKKIDISSMQGETLYLFVEMY